MPIIPKNIDPSQDYVTPGNTPALTQDGIVYNKIYAHTGVVDTLHASQNTSAYNDPTLNVNNSNNVINFNTYSQTDWISSTQYGGPNSTPVVLTMYMSNDTYFNVVNLSVLNVPCYVELLDSNGNPLSDNSTFVVAGGTDIHTTTDWINLSFRAPSTLLVQASKFIQVRITRNKTVQQQSSITKTMVDVQYSVGVKNFGIKLNIKSNADVPSAPFVVQNRFGFIENYKKVTYGVNNALNATPNTYWKSSPQPVGDSIVNFYINASTVSSGNTYPTTINRLLLNPVYAGCQFNLYYTTATSGITSSGAVSTDPSTFVWTPLQRDFILRKGLYEIPSITCTYIKLEFTKLAPQVYDLPFDSVERTINVFPYDVEQYYTNIEDSIIDGATKTFSFLGNNNNQAPTYYNRSSTLFGNANDPNASSWPGVGALTASQTASSLNPSITSSSSVLDPSSSYKLINSDGTYNGQSYTQFLQRRFPTARQHSYSQITISHSWHQAYFVGLYSVNAFYETTNYDDIRPALSGMISKYGNNTFAAQDNINYILLNSDDTATTPWLPTIDNFNAFSIAGLTTDWNSFLTDKQVLLNDTSNLLYNSNVVQPLQAVSNLGTSSVIQVAPVSSGVTTVYTGNYVSSTNLINYLDANFLNGTTTWSGLGGTTLTSTNVSWVSGTTNGTASGITVSGGQFSAAYNFTLPNVTSPSGLQPWQVQFGAAAFGVVGFASYTPASGFNYYFLTNVQTSGTASGVPTVNTNITMYTQFINPSNGAAIAGTTVTGTSASVVSGTGSNIITATGTNYSAQIPSNVLQLVISGTTYPFNIYQLGAFSTPTTTWTSPSDRNNMRVSAVARMFLPGSNNGTYRISLYATDYSGNIKEVAYKQFNANSLPINTWINVEVPSYSSTNYKSFSAQVSQTNPQVKETFYLSLLSPFYHPIRYEYVTQSGATNWQPILTGINHPDASISTVSGVAASGIQVRMTALDGGVFISGLSIVPRYDQSPYFIDTNIDYIGNSKTNELSSRRKLSSKTYFMLNQEVYPSRFSIEQVANVSVSYITL